MVIVILHVPLRQPLRYRVRHSTHSDRTSQEDSVVLARQLVEEGWGQRQVYNDRAAADGMACM